MTPALRHRPVPKSPLARWDARWKLAALLPAAAAAASLDRVAPAAAAFAASLGLVLLARLPRRIVRDRLAVMSLAVLPFWLVLPFVSGPDGPGFDLGPLSVSERGLSTAAAVVLRCLAVGCIGLVLVGTSPVHHTLAAAHRLGLPGPLVRLALLAYRYAFLLADELRRLRVALRARGFRPRANAHGYRTLGHVAGALLVRGADRADRVAEAMRCRGFDGGFHTLAGFRTAPSDALSFLALAGGTIALVLWDRER